MHEDKDTTLADHAAHRDEQGNMQMDDINIPLVAVSVAFFGVLLAVTIITLQAWFYNRQAAERQEKTMPRDFAGDATHKGTELGVLWKMQRTEINDPAHAMTRPAPVVATSTAPGATAPVTAPAPKRISIDEAIASIVKDGEK